MISVGTCDSSSVRLRVRYICWLLGYWLLGYNMSDLYYDVRVGMIITTEAILLSVTLGIMLVGATWVFSLRVVNLIR